MPATFAAVSPRIWDATLRRTGTNARLVRAYIATCPSKTTEGLFRLNLGYIAADTGLSPDDVTEAMDELDGAGLIRWDAENEVVFDPLALEVANITKAGDNRIAGALRQLRAVGQTTLYDEFMTHVKTVAPVLAEAIYELEHRLSVTRQSDLGTLEPVVDVLNVRMN